MYQQHTLPWYEPLALASAIDNIDEDFVLLYSALLTKYSGRYSYLGYSAIKSITNLLDLELALKQERWFGYLSYEMLYGEEYDLQHYIKMPKVLMVQFVYVIVFDHQNKFCTLISNQQDPYIPKPQIIPNSNVAVEKLYSNMSKDEYCSNIAKTLEAIKRGDFYQANITRKFYGTLSKGFHAFGIFAELCIQNPAPYAAFLKLGKYRVLSSSPEMFIRLNSDGYAENNLIKGTSARFANKEQDELSRLTLQNSKKDQSENIMIVDLMRNDFTKGSYTDSITVSELYKIYSYATVHHALSTVKSKKLPDISSFQFIKNCFPAGSITGAPKIQVMKWCAQIEKWRRGIYSGSIGWFNDDGSADLSVVIRTLILEDDKFEFQVGGGIVYESTPENEWQETLMKAQAIAKVLNLDMSELVAI